MIADDYPFFAAFWTLAFLSLGIIFLYLLLWVFADLFRNHDIGALEKTLWLAIVIFAPFVGILGYVILRVRTRELALTERGYREARARHQQWQKAENKY